MEFGIISVASITAIAFLAGFIWKTATKDELHKWIPSICGILGLILGLVAYFLKIPDFPASDVINAMAIGTVSGLAATGVHQVGHQLSSSNTSIVTTDVTLIEDNRESVHENVSDEDEE